ncbi:MAG: hypothetical protein IJR34_00615, partial [Bacteroidales bacterium]|nr:hypothetical protein [Bacteroidales bacterium]
NSVSISGCTFTNNSTVAYSASQNSGAAVKVGRGSVTLEDCRFEGNHIGDGVSGNGAALWLSDEGTTLSDDVIRVKNCSFSDNYTNSTVSKGGAVFVQRYKRVIFEGCTFSGNECRNEAAYSFAGAAMIGVYNSTGQSFPAGDIDCQFKDCTFDGNDVAAGESLKNNGGAGVYLNQNGTATVSLTLDGCEIKNHDLPQGRGAAVYAKTGTLSLKDCLIHDNSVGSAGAGLFIQGAACTLTDTDITANAAGGGGAGIYVESGTLSVSGGSISDNSANAGAAAVRVSATGLTGEDRLSFSGVAFARNSSSGFGCIAIYKNTDASFTDCTFTDNHTTNRGGACYFGGEDGAANSIAFSGCTFSGNYCTYGGGAIHVGNAGNKAYDVKGGNTTATLAATGYYDSCNTALSISNCSFTGNYSTSEGSGAVHCQTSGAVTISGSLFDGNYTGSNDKFNSGGALHLAYGQVSTAAGTEEDPCVSAGVVQSPKKGDFTLSDCTFRDNHTLRNGGGYNLDCGGAISVANGTKLSSSVTAANPCLVKINHCNFIHNSATQGGALALWDAAADVYVSNSLFYRNYITRAGGSIVSHFRGGLHLNNTTMTEAWGSWNAAYINYQQGCLTIANSSLIGVPKSGENTVGGTGEGLIRFDGTSESSQQRTHIINSIICCTRTDRNAFCAWFDTTPYVVTLSD